MKLWAIATCVLIPVSFLNAQKPAGEDATAKKSYEELIQTPILPPRNEEDIKADLGAAGNTMKQLDKAIADTQSRAQEAKGWLATHKTEMDGLSANLFSVFQHINARGNLARTLAVRGINYVIGIGFGF